MLQMYKYCSGKVIKFLRCWSSSVVYEKYIDFYLHISARDFRLENFDQIYLPFTQEFLYTCNQSGRCCVNLQHYEIALEMHLEL